MTGTGNAESLRLELARLAALHGDVPIRYIDDVSLPVDDGRYVSLVLIAAGAAAEVIVMTPETFYESLRKVMAAALPSLSHMPPS